MALFESNRFLFFSLRYFFKWLLITAVVGSIIGSASAVFLLSLDAVTNFREAHPWILFLLPIAGLVIAVLYRYWGADVVKGNNLLLEEVEEPKQTVPIKMAPLVYIGTLLTHLFGGSAGREGTAVQMGGAIADQFTDLFKLDAAERKLMLIVGMSAGFASVFNTPIAGAVFALEVLYIGRLRYEAAIPSFMAAFASYYVCNLWPLTHTVYAIIDVPILSWITISWTVFAGICFGLTSKLFSFSMHTLSRMFANYIKCPLIRPVIGGFVMLVLVYFFGLTKYMGLGIPVIIESFIQQQETEVFLIKIALTVITLSAGFKGGEVTPLFFIGATLGSALSLFLPLPVSLLAGMGFMAVFAGAANTPIACIFMGIELFGMESVLYIAIASVIAYFCSGHVGIYRSQKGSKWLLFSFLKTN